MGFLGAPFLNFAVHAIHVRPSGRETIRAECSVSLRCAHEDALRLISFGGKLLLVCYTRWTVQDRVQQGLVTPGSTRLRRLLCLYGGCVTRKKWLRFVSMVVV